MNISYLDEEDDESEDDDDDLEVEDEDLEVDDEPVDQDYIHKNWHQSLHDKDYYNKSWHRSLHKEDYRNANAIQRNQCFRSTCFTFRLLIILLLFHRGLTKSCRRLMTLFMECYSKTCRN